MRQNWLIASSPSPASETLAQELGLSPITAAILASRLTDPTPEKAEAFLRPSLAQLLSPWELPQMDLAAGRLARAIAEREKTVIYGDYDADGVTACTIMLRILQALGHPTDHYLPARITEGYGISDDFVAKALAEGVKLVVTVDCGMHDHAQIAALQQGGVDVVVTDHHEPGESAPPPALAVVNPKADGSPYPFRELTGAGLAFKLAWAVCEKCVGSSKVGPRLQAELISLLPVAAIGTIADVAPLIEENRVYAVHGLRGLADPLPGLKALLEIGGIQSENVTPWNVAISLAPRLNAAGRMGNAELALRLLLADDPAEALAIGRELDTENQARQQLCQAIGAEAREEVLAIHDPTHDAALVVARPGWHEGVIGIVASRLVEEFGRPAAVIAAGDGPEGKGSARSIDGVDLYAAMAECRHLLSSFGGHTGATGFRLPKENIAPLRAALDAACRRQIESKRIQPTLSIDAQLGLGDITDALLRELELLAPFGSGNPRPRFLVRDVKVVGKPQLLGRSGKHFSFNAAQNGRAYRAVVFNNVAWMYDIDRGRRRWDIVFSLNLNDFYTPPRLEFHVEDMRPCSGDGE